MNNKGKADLARSVIFAFRPLIKVFLELGITSPEAESLLRSLYVHTAREWLAQSQADRGQPSDAQVALVTGVHRNFVSTLLASRPKIAAHREKKGHPAERLLNAWHSDPAYLDVSGKPRDLSETGREPSFDSLVARHVPGVAAGMLLKELLRAGMVQSISDRRVRARSRTYRVSGLNPGNMAEISRRTSALLQTLIDNARDPAAGPFYGAMPEIDVDSERLPFVRELLRRRTNTFLQALADEFPSERRSKAAASSTRRTRVGLTVYQTEQPPNAAGARSLGHD